MRAPLKRQILLVAVLVFGFATPGLGQGATENTSAAPSIPERTKGLRTLEIADDLFDEGLPYYLVSGADTQFTFSAETPLQRLVATSSRAVGYLIGPFDLDELETGQSPIAAGAIRVPVSSIRSNTNFDSTLSGAGGLDAANHPEVSFLVEESSLLSRLESSDADTSRFAVRLQGKLAVKDRSVPLDTEAELTMILSNNLTFSRGAGDFAILRGAFDLELEPLGLGPRVLRSLGGTVAVDFALVFTTPDPERPMLAPATREAFWLQNRYLASLRDLGDPAAAYATGEELLQAAWDDAQTLSRFAATAILSVEGDRRFVEQGERAARRALELGGDAPDPNALNALARLAAERSDFAQAVELQTRAIAGLTGRAAVFAKPAMEQSLALYERLIAHSDGED